MSSKDFHFLSILVLKTFLLIRKLVLKNFKNVSENSEKLGSGSELSEKTLCQDIFLIACLNTFIFSLLITLVLVVCVVHLLKWNVLRLQTCNIGRWSEISLKRIPMGVCISIKTISNISLMFVFKSSRFFWFSCSLMYIQIPLPFLFVLFKSYIVINLQFVVLFSYSCLPMFWLNLLYLNFYLVNHLSF